MSSEWRYFFSWSGAGISTMVAYALCVGLGDSSSPKNWAICVLVGIIAAILMICVLRVGGGFVVSALIPSAARSLVDAGSETTATARPPRLQRYLERAETGAEVRG